MKQEDKLRQTLREYYDNQEAPYSENEWERAGAYLSRVRRGRRLRNAVFILMPLVFALGMALLYLPASSGLAPGKQEPSHLNSEPAAIARPLAVSSEPAVSAPAAEAQSNSNTHNKIKQPTQAISTLPETQQIPAETRSAANTVSGAKRPAQGSGPGAGNATKPAILAGQSFAASPGADVNVSAGNGNKQNEMKLETTTDEKKLAEPVAIKEEEVIDQDQTKEQLPPAPDSVLPPAAVNDHREEPGAATDTVSSASSTGTTLTVKADTTHSASMAAIVPDTLLPLAGEGIFYEAGAAWLYGWKGPEHRDARGFSPVIGISYMNSLSRRCAFSFGLRYLMVPDLSNSSKTSRVSSYGYGEQSSVTVITPSALHYLVAPLRFHYYMSPRNSFGLGINIAYLLNVDATVTSYDERPGYTGNYKTMKQGGYMQGFSWFDSQLAVSYSRRIAGAFALQAEVFIGLTDVKQDAFFGFKNTERNSGLKLSLIYYAFKKNSRK